MLCRHGLCERCEGCAACERERGDGHTYWYNRALNAHVCVECSARAGRVVHADYCEGV